MPLTYASLCDGIGAVHVAWRPLGWRCAWVSENTPFPEAVVQQRWGLANLGDMTLITGRKAFEHGRVDLVAGGTPCQSFSVAGLRRGLADPRGNLALVFLRIVAELRPRWMLWENVPGVLSSNGGRDLGAVLGAMAELGYGFAWRILDAQFFGVPQRRRRVFVVGYSGDWRPAAAVLLEPPGLPGDSPAGRPARPGVARGPASISGGGGAAERPLNAPVAFSGKDHGGDAAEEPCPTLRAGVHRDSHANGGNRPAAAYAFQPRIGRSGRGRPSRLAPALAGSGAAQPATRGRALWLDTPCGG